MKEVNTFIDDVNKFMKNNILILPLFTLFLSFSVYGDNSSTHKIPVHPNHIYLGPDVFVFDLDTHVKTIKVHGLKLFEGLRLRYEYLKPHSLYGGLDLFSAVSNHSFQAKKHDIHFHKNNNITGFSNFELRLGYAVSIEKKKLLTPFLGFGGYYFANYGHHFHFHEMMLYYAAGMRCAFEINPGFALGLNWKIFHTFDSDQKFKYKLRRNITKKDHDNVWGGEIGIPIDWHVGSAKKWDIQLEPYFLKLAFSEVQNIYGIRLLFGYLF